MFDHRVCMYGADEALVAGAAPFLSEGVNNSEAALAVTSRHNISLLRRRLGRAAGGVQFVENASWHGSPVAALGAFNEFCTAALEQGSVWMRILAEVSWGHQPAGGVRSWMRLEALLNVVLAHQPVSMLCLCDERSVQPRLRRQLMLMHPESVGLDQPGQALATSDPRALLLEP
jgi:hypothetical protein